MDAWVLLGLGVLGLATGAAGTLIGAGGGFILMPILALLYPRERPETLASISLAVVFFNALSGSIGYARMKRIDYRAGTIFAAATVPGAVLGALVTGMLPRRVFDLVLGGVIVAVGLFILASTRRGSRRRVLLDEQPEDGNDPARRGYSRTLGVLISLVVGFISSLLGIGGGIIHVPALVFLLRFPVHVATATSHFVLAITAFTGTAVHIEQGTFHQGWRRTTALAIGVVAGAQIGAHLSSRTRHTHILRGLAAALVLVGLRIILGDLL